MAKLSFPFHASHAKILLFWDRRNAVIQMKGDVTKGLPLSMSYKSLQRCNISARFSALHWACALKTLSTRIRKFLSPSKRLCSFLLFGVWPQVACQRKRIPACCFTFFWWHEPLTGEKPPRWGSCAGKKQEERRERAGRKLGRGSSRLGSLNPQQTPALCKTQQCSVYT